MKTASEFATVYTPLGIRFWDPAFDRPVTDNLQVTARLEQTSYPVATAFRTASGIYAFQGLPGLYPIEHPVIDEPPIASPPFQKRFTVTVSDLQDRFLPLLFQVDLPLPYEGIYPAPQNQATGDSFAKFYLFSAPARPTSPGLAAVRGQVVDYYTGVPAAFVCLEITVNGQKMYGIADDRGVLAILLPYPPLASTLGGSPPGLKLSALGDQRWEVTITVRYNQASLEYPPGAEIPDLRSIINQPLGLAWLTEDGLPAPSITFDLTFGKDLILRTGDLSKLLIGQGGSPL
jgi:hypothetical protein